MKSLFLPVLFLFSAFSSSAQDIINPYLKPPVASNYMNYHSSNSNNPFDHDFEITEPILRGTYYYNNSSLNFNLQNYAGEYEISLVVHPWYYLFMEPNLINPPRIFTISYNYEVVSFPFQMDCIYSTGNCTEQAPCSTHVRILTLPIEDNTHFTHPLNGNYFQYASIPITGASDKLYLKTPTNDFFSYYSSGNLGGLVRPANTLISAYFFINSGANNGRYNLPHSIIKCNLNIHCGPTENDPIIKTISYYYDNTRGQMRYYPFRACNASIVNGSAVNPADYDLIFYPEILYGSNSYQNADHDLILADGSLDYFPFAENTAPSSSCNSTTLNLPTSGSNYNPLNKLYYHNNTYNNIGANSSLIYPSPYSLQSNLLRGYDGHYLAGYDEPLPNSPNLTDKPGIRHSYFIDQNTDLNIINPSDKIIYNPSEATITASDFIFPQGYTFKTIRGVYPSPVDAANANILSNGCSPCDLRDAPAKSDLTSENPDDAVNFPLSAQPATQHLYASRYYLENNSRLTIENCVRLFDCTFDVKQGATMVFNDYPARFGKEDHSFDRADARFKIQTLGGAVLRNYADVQYLQNGNITQATPLHYKAVNEIYAGNNVEPDADVPQQDYVVQNGADVTLEAGDVIYLKDGFHALAGSTFSAIASSPGSSSGPCTPVSVSLRRAGEAGSNTETKENSIQAYPNPSAGMFKLHQHFMPFAAHKITILDTFGRTIFSKSNFNSFTDKIDLSDQPNGIYVALVQSDSKIQSVKLIVNH
jgi:hypothetical protein